MERVAFLVDGTGERIDCLLNPETLESHRLAGIRTRGTADGQLVGTGQRDDPLSFTGGGRTELRLDLVFDVDLVDSGTPATDVRSLTHRLWTLAENSAPDGGRPPQVRLVWGKAWNIPGVVAAIAERFDAFGPDGVPRRSWLRLKLVRTGATTTSGPAPSFDRQLAGPAAGTGAGGGTPGRGTPSGAAVQVIGGGASNAGGGVTRIDLLAAEAVGDPLQWRLLAEHNDITDPFDVAPGTVLASPRRSA